MCSCVCPSPLLTSIPLSLHLSRGRRWQKEEGGGPKKKSPRKEVSKVASLHILQSFIQQIWPIMKMLKMLLKFRQIKLQKPQKSSFSKGFCFRISLIGIQRKFILCEKICFMKCASFGEKCNFESCVDDMDHQYFLSMTVSTTTWICENSTPDLCRRPISISSDGSAIISCLSLCYIVPTIRRKGSQALPNAVIFGLRTTC